MQSGEACWDLPDDHFSMATGSQAVIFPAGRRHRISNGVYTPCRLLWMVFQPKETGARLRAPLPRLRDRGAVRDGATARSGRSTCPRACHRMLGELCSRLTDERLMIGSAPIMAEVRSKIYSSVTSLWEVCASGRQLRARRASSCGRPRRCCARAPTTTTADKDESIEDVARQLGYGKSRLYSLFTREVGMAPNDYRQRMRIKRCCERLTRSDDSVTAIGIDSGFHSSQYFSRVFKKYVGVTPTDYRRLFRAR